MADRLRVLVVEPWLSGSHRAWVEGFARSSRHEVHVCALEGTSWRWRLLDLRPGRVPRRGPARC